MATTQRIGGMTKRLTIQYNNPTDGTADTHYQPADSWETYMTVWGEVDSGPSRKFWAAQQIHQDVTHVVMIFWRQELDISKEIRFKWTDRAGRVHTLYPLGPAVNLDGNANRFFEFACVERV